MQRADGLILIDTALDYELSVPVVAVAGHRAIKGVTNVVLDHRRAAELSLLHLQKLGHRHIAFMRGQPFSSDSHIRWKHIVDVAKELGIVIDKALTVALERDIASPDLGYPVVQDLLKKKRGFTTIVSFNDMAAIGAIRALVDAKLRVPEDVSVVGFDDIQLSAYHTPRLTTIRQPLRDMGVSAARILLQRLQGLAKYPAEVAVPPELVVRETSSHAPQSRHSTPLLAGGS